MSLQPRIAIIVLNYNTAAMTDALAQYLQRDLVYPNKHLFVIDNASTEPPVSTTHRLPENLGFTGGMHEGWRIAAAQNDFDAYWFLNSDIGFEYGNEVLLALADVLFSRAGHAQIAPQMNSPHIFMERARFEAECVPYLEPTATLIKAATIRDVGFWDLELAHGWGVDYDYGYRIRQAGLASILTNRARITHKEHKSIADWPRFVDRAASEMHAVLGRKYGPGWERIIRAGRIVPVILTCCRDLEVTAQFISSFQRVQRVLDPPRVLIDLSASTRVTARYLELVASIAPAWVEFHPRESNISVYDSVQEAATRALALALPDVGPNDAILFLEDDVVFSRGFEDLMLKAQVPHDAGFLTLYAPGAGYPAGPIAPDRFYGTQALLFPRCAAADIVEHQQEMQASIPPGYDIRWSRWLARRGYVLYAAPESWVQHVGQRSRLHDSASHTSTTFRG